jgi:D-alanine-D-alanine ligase
MNLTNKTIGVFFGGQSPEHDVSIITGRLVVSELEKLGYHTVPVYVGTDGAWSIGEELRDTQFMRNVHTKDLRSLQGWHLDTTHRTPYLTLYRRDRTTESITIDVAFPALHGPFGEDGTIQGLCELLGVPYVGSPVDSTSITSDKSLTKRLFAEVGVSTPPFTEVTRNMWRASGDETIATIVEQFTFPVFIKPVHGGSSIGVTYASTHDELFNGLEDALQMDTNALVEVAVTPMHDITCCMRELADGAVECSELQDSSFGDDQFFSYEQKYFDRGGGQFGAENKLQIPAQIPESITRDIKDCARTVFGVFRMSGIGRVDFLYQPQTGEFYANEINSMPGTLYTHLWEKSGVMTADLLQSLLETAQHKYKRKLRMNHYFASSVLHQMGGAKN